MSGNIINYMSSAALKSYVNHKYPDISEDARSGIVSDITGTNGYNNAVTEFGAQVDRQAKRFSIMDVKEGLSFIPELGGVIDGGIDALQQGQSMYSDMQSYQQVKQELDAADKKEAPIIAKKRAETKKLEKKHHAKIMQELAAKDIVDTEKRKEFIKLNIGKHKELTDKLLKHANNENEPEPNEAEKADWAEIHAHIFVEKLHKNAQKTGQVVAKLRSKHIVDDNTNKKVFRMHNLATGQTHTVTNTGETYVSGDDNTGVSQPLDEKHIADSTSKTELGNLFSGSKKESDNKPSADEMKDKKLKDDRTAKTGLGNLFSGPKKVSDIKGKLPDPLAPRAAPPQANRKSSFDSPQRPQQRGPAPMPRPPSAGPSYVPPRAGPRAGPPPEPRAKPPPRAKPTPPSAAADSCSREELKKVQEKDPILLSAIQNGKDPNVDCRSYNQFPVACEGDNNAIKKAYKKQALTFHSDKNTGCEKSSEEKFKCLSALKCCSTPPCDSPRGGGKRKTRKRKTFKRIIPVSKRKSVKRKTRRHRS